MIKELKKEASELNILFVEDDESARNFLQTFLSKFFKTVIVAENGQEGLDAYLNSHIPFDIVLTDITMPIMNGIQMIEEIRKVDPRQIIVVLSAHHDTANLLKAIELMVEYFIVKPVDDEKLLAVLLKICGRANRRKEFQRLQAMETKNQINKALNISWQLVVDSFPLAGFITNNEGIIEYYNNEFSDLFDFVNDSDKMKELENKQLNVNELFETEDDPLLSCLTPDLLCGEPMIQKMSLSGGIRAEVRVQKNVSDEGETHTIYCCRVID